MCKRLIFLLSLILLNNSNVYSQEKLQPIGEEAYQVLLRFYQYDKDIPLDVRIVEKMDMDNCAREKIVFTGIRNSRVPSYLAIPKMGKPPYPVILLLYGMGQTKDDWWNKLRKANVGYFVIEELLAQGYAVFTMDYPYHGERISENEYENIYKAFIDGRKQWRVFDTVVTSCIEYRKAIDYLSTCAEIDSSRIGILGYSLGGVMSCCLSAVEPRIRVTVDCVGYSPDSIDYAPRIQQPILFMMAKKDTWYDERKCERLLENVGSQKKNLIWYDTGHSIPQEYSKEASKWFKEHL
ncbi:MAG: alpha/beta fold hydrolase [Candidatus Latescibacteria bacterium]|nr:alpha/beta fold hydrolase [Candidatus Latescibacterota bacterium]